MFTFTLWRRQICFAAEGAVTLTSSDCEKLVNDGAIFVAEPAPLFGHEVNKLTPR